MKSLMLLVPAALMLAAAPAAWAQKPIPPQGAAITETFTIEAIDHSNRLVTLKDADGNLEDVFAGPEVQRFKELKVGQRVTFRYYESLVLQIRRTGQPAAKPADTATIVRTPDAPGGTASRQSTTTVTINAIDQKTPSVTFTTADGRKMSLKVEDRKNIDGLKIGDRVEITYTQALVVGVEPPK